MNPNKVLMAFYQVDLAREKAKHKTVAGVANWSCPVYSCPHKQQWYKKHLHTETSRQMSLNAFSLHGIRPSNCLEFDTEENFRLVNIEVQLSTHRKTSCTTVIKPIAH